MSESQSDSSVPGSTRLAPALWVIAALAAVVLLYAGRSVLIPIVLSVLVSYALEPIVSWLQRLAVPRLIGTTMVMTLLSGGIVATGYGLHHQATALVDDLPRAARTLREQIRASRSPGGTLEKLDRARSEIERASQDLTNAGIAPLPTAPSQETNLSLAQFFWWGSAGLLALTGHALVIFFLIFFMLLSGDLFKRKLLKIAGETLSRKTVTLEALNEINAEIRRYLLVRVITSMVVALATWAALAWVGLQNPAIWGIGAGVANVIPYLGPALVSGGISIVALLQFGNLYLAALAAGLALLITALEGWLLDPALMGKVARLNPVAILIGLIFWTAVWGAWGALLAVPLLSVTKSICDRIEGFKPLGELLGE